jgi:hypothetical protein
VIGHIAAFAAAAFRFDEEAMKAGRLHSQAACQWLGRSEFVFSGRKIGYAAEFRRTR